MFNVSWGWLYTHSRWSVGRHCTHDGPPLCWSSFTGALILVLHGQCVTQVARGDIVIILDWCFILEWCLCDFLLLLSLKHIDEVDGLHPHLSLTYFLCVKCSTISILLLTIYLCWLFFVWKMFLSFSTDVYVIYCYWNISMKWMDFHLHLSLTDVDIFLCGKYSTISILLWIIYWCWLFFMWKMLLSFSTDVYVIFCYWNISMKCTHFMLIWHLLMLTYFLCRKYSRISILCKMFLSFSTDVYVIFCYWNISMKWMEFHLHLSLTDVDIFFVWKIFYDLNTGFDYLLMLTIFHVQNVLIILDWCFCDFLLLKYINEVDGVPSSFVTYWCWHIFCVENILRFQYCFGLFTDVDYFSCAKCSYHSRLMVMWFSVTETYWWSACTSCWFVIYWCWHIFVWKIFYDLNTAFDYLLMLTIFHV